MTPCAPLAPDTRLAHLPLSCSRPSAGALGLTVETAELDESDESELGSCVTYSARRLRASGRMRLMRSSVFQAGLCGSAEETLASPGERAGRCLAYAERGRWLSAYLGR